MKHTRNKILMIRGMALCFIFSVFFSSRMTQAQENGIRFGPKIGVSSSVFSRQFDGFTQRKTGVVGGANVTFGFGSVGISLDVLYSQQGASEVNPSYLYPTYESGDGSASYNYYNHVTLHTLEAPLVIQYSLLTGSTVSPKIYLGGSFDFFLSAKAKGLDRIYPDNSTGWIVTGWEDEDVSNSFEFYNYSALAGIAFDITTGGKLDYVLEFRYKMGLGEISNLSTLTVNNSYRTNFSINSLQILFGIKF